MQDNLLELLASIIRVGQVSSVNPAKHTARVIFLDQDEIVSYELQVAARNAFKNKDYNLPDVDEQVLCIFLPISLSQGFIICSLYNDTDKPADNDQNVRSMVFADGTRIEYNRDTHKLKVSCIGDIEATCKNAKIIAENQVLFNVAGTTMIIDSDGLYVNNKIHATDVIKSDSDIQAGGISGKNHIHKVGTTPTTPPE